MKTIIFDMDGTILDTIVDITNAVNYILEKNGMLKRTVDEVKFFVGNGLYKTLERSVPEGTNEEVVKGIYEEMVAYYKAHSDINTKPYDGIIDVIKEIKKKGYKTAVVSNKRHEAVVELCHVFYEGLFDEILGDSEGIAKKPEPDMVNIVLDRLGISSNEAIYIGDSDVDILTAKNSKLKGIFVSWGFRTKEFLIEHGATCIVDAPDELLGLL